MSHNLGLKIESEKRFEKFVERVKKTQLVWGLKSAEGWSVSPSNDFEDATVMPFWSESAYAKQCAREEWAHYASESIPLDEFVNAWIPGLDDDNLLIGTDWNVHLLGKEIEPLELLAKLLEK
ncbi:DUF2750 domain-containing protein [Paenibacillus qinlingensis]|uniref:DUF2750 domain-containing protein n=1 Tax=Paenibacillus qinlingensis TaxID=1837343 RepID=UPI001563CBA0|nr:DUF2750 domain-containing protein [Paenibacillus qinlingensis]NQX63686.1 DUF2750 domain-containing protein [Paenibacillus qinlingensis]